jgi:imidazolonepropionase-like amidohydrolase
MVLIKNGKILTMAGHVYEKGCILIKDGKIAKVGENIEIKGMVVKEPELVNGCHHMNKQEYAQKERDEKNTVTVIDAEGCWEGLGVEEALKAVTINAAEICNVSDRVGSIEAGKDADIAIFDGDPMNIFTKTLYTIIDGKIVYSENETRNRSLSYSGL